MPTHTQGWPCQVAGTVCAKVLGNEKGRMASLRDQKRNCRQANFHGRRRGFADIKLPLYPFTSHFRAPESPDAPPRNPGGPALQQTRRFTHFKVTYWVDPPQRIVMEELTEGNA